MPERGHLPETAIMRGKIAPAKFAHVVFRTGRYEKMINWYKSVLEAEPMYANDFITFLTYDDEHHRVAIAKAPALLPKLRTQSGVDHIAFTYATLGDLLATYQRVNALGIRPYWCINHGGTTSMYYQDPDHNHVELQIDNFTTPEEINAFLDGPEFTENPIGEDFDPDEMVTRFLAIGTPDMVLDRFRLYRSVGIDSLTLRVDGAGRDDRIALLEQIVDLIGSLG